MKRTKPRSRSTTCSSRSTNADSQSSQETIAEAFTRAQKLDYRSRENIQLTKSVTYCIAKDMLPIYTVEKPGFRKMLERFNPCYSLPSRRYFSRIAIPALYNEVRGRIESERQW